MGTKARSKHQEGLYKAYQANNRQATNRKRKLERALKRQPGNEEILSAIKLIKYRRNTPKTRQWTKTKIKEAMLFASFNKGEYIKFDFKPSEMFKIGVRVGMQDSLS